MSDKTRIDLKPTPECTNGDEYDAAREAAIEGMRKALTDIESMLDVIRHWKFESEEHKCSVSDLQNISQKALAAFEKVRK